MSSDWPIRDGVTRLRTVPEKIERLSGYKEVMNRPEIRRKLAENILRAAKPHLVAYDVTIERIAREFDVKCGTACRYLLASQTKVERFVFENLIQHDPAYMQFLSHKGFRETYLSVLQRRNAHPQEYGENYIPRVEAITTEMNAEFGIDVFLFTKFLLSKNRICKQVMKLAAK